MKASSFVVIVFGLLLQESRMKENKIGAGDFIGGAR